MPYIKITEEQARAIMAEPDAQNTPSRRLNEAGCAAVRDFIQQHAKRPGEHNSDAWYDAAEEVANDAGPGETIILEMRGTQARGGNPQTLRMEDAHFDWEVNV